MPKRFTRFFANTSVEFTIQEDNEMEFIIKDQTPITNIFPIIYEFMENVLKLDTKSRQLFDEMLEEYIIKQLEKEDLKDGMEDNKC